MNQAYNNALGLTDNLTNSLSMLESLQTQSNRSQNRLSEELASSWIQKPSHLKDTPQATVSPRVMGHAITKPSIRFGFT